jgi:acetate kinase
MNVLVLNTGSSTVKFSLVESDTEQTLLEGLCDWSATPAHFELRSPGAPPQKETLRVPDPSTALTHVLTELAARLGGKSVAAVGHRMVHGGPTHTRSERITDELLKSLSRLTELAPLHNPLNVEGMRAARLAWPNVPHVVAFDTAFHATMPEQTRTYAIPYRWTEEWAVRRYGFHGLSVAYCADRAARMLQRSPDGLRLIVAHLGNGASLTAVRDGRSLDTTMGFTPLEGIMMGTRSGSLDPGALIYLLRHKGLSADDLDRVLNRESGLLGVSGISGDMRDVQDRAKEGAPRAILAMGIYVNRLRQAIGALAATLGGLDALIFTAGVGERAASIRAAACSGLEFMGIELDESANNQCRPDADVAGASSKVRILVIATREDLTIVRETMRVIGDAR